MAIFVSTQQMTDNLLNNVFNVILHEGLTTYKAKHSNAALPARVEANKADKQHKKGAIFAVRSKSDFTSHGVKGYVVTSKETLLEDVSSLTHFTPNVYRKFGYSDDKRSMIKGFEEKNLLQINTFVVDIDTKRYSVQDILMACIDESIGSPTLIVESTRGYQVYFALSTPLFISNKNDFRGLKVAKRISDNLKKSLKDVGADLYCNDFGFFRLPKFDNIAWVQLDHTYSIAQLIDWSRRQDDDQERPLFVVLSKLTQSSVMQSEWFSKLVQAVDIKGQKGQLGRNNAMFTLALVCFSESWEKERTFDFLDEYNSNLNYPLATAEINTLLNSAYSGKYKGASKEYVKALLEQYVKDGSSIEVNFGYKGGWYKFKKERKDRTRSHYEEWEQDIIDYITAEKSDSRLFLWHTQKELCAAIGIPQSTLNVVLKQSTRLLKTTKGKGRYAKTGWTTISLFIKYAWNIAKEMATKKGLYRNGLQTLVLEWIDNLEIIAGYDLLIQYLQKLEFIPASFSSKIEKSSSG